MDKEQTIKEVETILNREPWISPDWPIYASCSEEEKEKLVFFCNMIAKFAPKSLGAVVVVFEKVNPIHQFIVYEKDLGHDPEFLDKYLLSSKELDINGI